MMPITLTNGAAAFLRHGDKYLLMKRAPNRKVAPDVWSGDRTKRLLTYPCTTESSENACFPRFLHV